MVTGDDGVASVKVILRASTFPLDIPHPRTPLVGLVHAIALVHLRPPPSLPPTHLNPSPLPPRP